MRKFPLTLLLFAIVLGCHPIDLERSDVPVYWGMRLNEPSDDWEFAPNLEAMRSVGMKRLVLELPLRADSAGFPMIAVVPSPNTAHLISQFGGQLTLAISTTHRGELFTKDVLPDSEAWFAAMAKTVEDAVHSVGDQSLERIVLSADWGPFSTDSVHWKQLLDGLRKRHVNAKISIGGRIEQLDTTGLAALSDEVVVDYPPMAGDELKSPSRAENQESSALCIRLKKPLFVFRANVIGDSPLLQIKNRLRFWPQELQISGICLNSLYPKLPLRDSLSYYGLHDNPDAVEFVKEYSARSTE